jgi:hypothetical protein
MVAEEAGDAERANEGLLRECSENLKEGSGKS